MRKDTTLVLYHANCMDGFAAAFAANKKFGALAKYMPVTYGNPPIDATGRDVVMVDFSYPPSELAELAERARSVVVIDHHEAAIRQLLAAPEALRSYHGSELVLNPEKSGCVLAWEYFFPTEPLPILFEYIQDQDLWKWRLPDSRAVFAGLSLEPLDFLVWVKLTEVDPIAYLADRGRAILDYQAILINEAVSRATMCDIGGYSVPCVNSTVLPNEVAEALYTYHPFAAVWHDTEEHRKFSLRSHPETGADVDKIARWYGGGGHPHAAGFRVPKV